MVYTYRAGAMAPTAARPIKTPSLRNARDPRLTRTFTGFGNNNTSNSTSLFGAKPAATGFGTSTTSGGLFGNSANTTPSTGFGSGSNTAFGGASNNTSSPFGGGNTATGGFGGFGNNNAVATNNAFGSGQQKSLFGAGGTGTTGGFGSTGGFGGSGTALTGSVPPPQGTNVVPFQAITEKEANGTSVSYQTITFMDPYAKYSLEELRLADYNGGRQFGTGTGSAGAFGQSNFSGSSFAGNTGGFGTNTGGSLFGSNNNNTTTASTGFGSNTATTGGFGSGNTGGLFGNSNQNKPGGLFGQTSSAAPSGGLFGTTNNAVSTTGGFGGFGANNNTNSGTSLFGNNNTNQTQNKPGGLFGSTSTTTPATGGFSFGANNNNQTNTTGGLFGSTNATANTGGGLFGNNNNNQTQQQTGSGGSLFGGTQNQNAGGGLFGAKPSTGFGAPAAQTQSGGLFGGGNNQTNTTGGLFGNTSTATTNTGGGLFGNNNATSNNAGGGLFGNQNQNKPAGGLFGATNNNSAGGGLFGGNTANNNTGGGLFGNNTNNNQQQSGGLFGGAANSNTGGLFGNSQNNQNKGGLFGGSTTQNNPGNSLFGGSVNTGGLFGASQNNQQQNPQQQEVKHASLLDPNPYGQSSIWTNLPAPNAENSKPLFTPLTATKKMQESAMKPLPSLRLNQSRYNTPPRRNGYGFSYSTYGTPSSVTSTPGGVSLSGSMYGNRGFSGGSFGRSFNRSASVQNLRSHYASDSDDVWKPNAFAPSHRNSSGSIKRLTIDRSIRQDLFNRPQVPALPAPKPSNNAEDPSSKALTDGNTEPVRKLNKRVSFENPVQESALNGTSGALVRTEQDSDEETTPPRNDNGATETARNGDLQAVPEDQESHQVSSKPAKVNPKPDQEPGAYWMKPSRQEIAKMPREQKRAFKGYQVGRNGCGFITFDGTVDLEALNLDDVFDHIVLLSIRSATVYPDPSTKPLVGKGLNVPSTIEIENSWPRSKGKLISEVGGRHYEQHIKRLKKMEGTEFINYDSARGIWKFKVPHYTTYGLDYEDEEDGMDQSELSLPPTSLENSADASVMEVDDHTDSIDDDDTFAFKRSVPGQFSKQSIIDEESELASGDDRAHPGYEDDGSDRSMVSDEDMMSDDDQSPNMPGSLPVATMEFSSPTRKPARPIVPGTPGKPLLDLEGDWAEQLQRTISPRKQNRDVLRQVQSKVLLDKNFSPLKPKPAAQQVNFKSSIDIMNSLFLPAGGKKANKATEPDFEV